MKRPPLVVFKGINNIQVAQIKGPQLATYNSQAAHEELPLAVFKEYQSIQVTHEESATCCIFQGINNIQVAHEETAACCF